MAFDPFGTLTKRYFASPAALMRSVSRIHWVGAPSPVPAEWSVASPYESQALAMLAASAMATKYEMYCNVPLQCIFTIDRRAFLQAYAKKPHWTGKAGAKPIRRSALRSLQSQIGTKAVDLLMCERGSGRIVGGIEVDGSHHRSQPQQTWDFSKSLFFAQHGLPLLRFSISDVYGSHQQFSAGNPRAFDALLRRSKSHWLSFVMAPSMVSMQLHHP